MKVIFKHKVFDFNNVERLHYRASVTGDGYPIGVHRKKGGIFNDEIVIARVYSEECAQKLIRDITEAWALNTPVFDIDDWLIKNPFAIELNAEDKKFVENQRALMESMSAELKKLQEIKEIEISTDKTKEKRKWTSKVLDALDKIITVENIFFGGLAIIAIGLYIFFIFEGLI